MKRIISVLVAVVIMLGLCVTGFAETENDDVLAPGLKFGPQWYDRFNEHYIYGENLSMKLSVLSADVYAEYEKIFLYIDCNKDVIEWTYKDFGENLCTETETGYMTEFDTMGLYYGTVVNWLDYEIKSFGNPDVSIRAEGLTRNGEIKELPIINGLPDNKIYNKEDIPHIEASLKPPAFAYMKQLTFNAKNGDRICLFSPMTVKEIMSMLSVAGGDGEIVYVPKDGIENEYPRTNDAFALKFEGRFCGVIYVEVVGDADDDGKVTASDARLVLRQGAMLEDGVVCDVNYDNKTNAADARMILRIAAQLDYYRIDDMNMCLNVPLKVGPLVSASDGGYLWKCTVSDPDAIEITEKTEPSVDNTGKPPEEIIIGAPVLQTFILKPLKQGKFEVHFELIRSWESEPIEEFGFTAVVDDVFA